MSTNAKMKEVQRGEPRFTPFGEKLRELRKSKGLLLIQLAEIAEVSPGFLSLVETGKKPIPERLITKIVSGLDLNQQEEADLTEAAALSAKVYSIKIEAGAEIIDRRVANALQNGFARMSPSHKAKILEMLEED